MPAEKKAPPLWRLLCSHLADVQQERLMNQKPAEPKHDLPPVAGCRGVACLRGDRKGMPESVSFKDYDANKDGYLSSMSSRPKARTIWPSGPLTAMEMNR